MRARTGKVARGRFEGLFRVIRFNWPFYVAAVATIVAALVFLASVELTSFQRLAVTALACIPIFFLVSSLAASFYIYDVSDLHRWEWLIQPLPAMPETWVAFNAGYDETGGALTGIFDARKGATFDIFDPAVFTEASIQRARKFATHDNQKSVPLNSLPFKNSSVDAIFLIMSVHEIRARALREIFFSELHRIARQGCRIIVVEHLRNSWNFAAFGHGALHFYPRHEWIQIASRSGLDLVDEIAKTPFVRALVFEKKQS